MKILKVINLIACLLCLIAAYIGVFKDTATIKGLILLTFAGLANLIIAYHD
jgi:hypothetical protein